MQVARLGIFGQRAACRVVVCRVAQLERTGGMDFVDAHTGFMNRGDRAFDLLEGDRLVAHIEAETNVCSHALEAAAFAGRRPQLFREELDRAGRGVEPAAWLRLEPE